MPTAIFYALFFLYVLLDPRLRPGAVFYAAPLLATLLPTLAINYSIHGSIMPVEIVREYFDYYGSPWIGSDELSGMHVNDLKFVLTYALFAFVGSKGFLLYNPFLAIALWGLVRVIRQRGPFFYEGIVVGSGSLVLVLYYLLTTNNYGGWCYGIRWFVPLLPMLLFFLYPFFEKYDHKRANLFWVLLCVSTIIAFVGAIDPWTLSAIDNFRELYFFVSNAFRGRPIS
jgi:hypothetical protein